MRSTISVDRWIAIVREYFDIIWWEIYGDCDLLSAMDICGSSEILINSFVY